ncbi:hypothetical protein Bpfe_022881 [Biomphalaria pfeifferi]|uniref:EF-hand domain-containing protein n=1 Tax=Biomphalaria pfeifferi TaxID=112525 RepID=A0AAD8B465_BIOPF|nr:hypothetical protein Bpfe_022881 [Biomphalaria pfeifferi]
MSLFRTFPGRDLVSFLILNLLSNSQGGTLNVDTLIQSINTDNTNTTVSVGEVDNFFGTFWSGPNVTRCSFVDRLVSMYSGVPSRLSVLFDALQSTDGQWLSASEWRAAWMGSEPFVSVSTAKNNWMKVEDTAERALTRPYEHTDRLLWYKYTDLELQRLANKFDNNSDGKISRYEVTMAMRTMDDHNDSGVRKCNFIDTMTSYKQHGAAAANFYDYIFNQRDLTWADVDSDFFLKTADDNGDGTVTRQELVRFFTLQNLKASGLSVQAETLDFTGNNRSHRMIGGFVIVLIVALQSGLIIL